MLLGKMEMRGYTTKNKNKRPREALLKFRPANQLIS